MRHIVSTFFSILVLVSASFAGCAYDVGVIRTTKPIPGGVEISGSSGALRIAALGEGVVRVWMPATVRHRSWAVVDGWQSEPQVAVVRTKSGVTLRTAEGSVEVGFRPLKISFFDRRHQSLQEDTAPATCQPGGFRLHKAMPEDEHYFGLGDKAGAFDRRGQQFVLWNTDAYGWQESTDPLYKSIPFYLALRPGRAYGIFFDNTYRSVFDFGRGARHELRFGADAGPLDYYFLFGPTPAEVVAQLARLTGTMPLPPLWALGFQQSRYSYEPESRVRELAQTFRAHRIPADAIYLDIDYQDGLRPFTIDRKKFPTFEQMVKDLGVEGFHIVAITDLHLKKEAGYAPYDQGVAGDDLVHNPDGSVYVGKVWPGDCVFPDFTLTRARAWWGTLYTDFARMGIAGFWNDMNEPAIFERADKTMPLDTIHRLDSGERTDHREIHNVFGMENARATYEGLEKLRPDERPFVLTRAAFAGAQRYAASWTGDNSSTWNHLRLNTPNVLSLNLSGYPLVGADVGGYVGSPPADLLTRWLELGAFLPLYRDHTGKGTADQEPWAHGPEQEAIRRRYIEARYRLLPYLYTTVEETSRNGTPIVRPLFYRYPDLPWTYGVDQEFFFGPDLLVSPVVSETVDPVGVGLPPGDWYDYWTGARVTGGRGIELHPQLDTLPVYVRAGAIIPQQPLVQSTAETPAGPLELRVYPGPDCHGAVYADDGHSLAYRRGIYLRQQFTCTLTPGGVQISLAEPQGSFTPWWKSFRVVVYGVEGPPVAATRDGRPVNAAYEAAPRAVYLDVPPGASTIELRWK